MTDRTPVSVPNEIRPLTGIRGIAALAVVFYHFRGAWNTMIPGLHPLWALSSHGLLAVELFFMLSGFVLSYAHDLGKRRLGWSGYAAFVGNRIARVYPNHAATLLFLAMVVPLGRWLHLPLMGDYPWSGLPSQIAMTHRWPFLFGGQWNYPSWSISAEWFAYLFVFPVTCRLGAVRLNPGLLAALIAGSLLVWNGIILALPQPDDLHLWAIVHVSCEFFAGAFAYGVWRQNSALLAACRRYVAATAIAILIVLAVLPEKFENFTLFLFPILLLGLTTEKNAIGAFLARPSMLWLGRVSYALYMSHAISQKMLRILLPFERFANASLSVRVLVAATQLAFVIGAATLLYTCVEVPAREKLRSLFNRASKKESTSQILEPELQS